MSYREFLIRYNMVASAEAYAEYKAWLEECEYQAWLNSRD